MGIAVLFSGQGAQKEGMGKSLYEHPKAQAIFDSAKELLGAHVFELTQEQLNQTRYTQPSIFALSMAAWACMDIQPDCMAGFSLGEYSALCASGVLSFKTALELVMKRAQWMDECTKQTPGGMAAVLGAEDAAIINIINSIKTEQILTPVNYNCPGQTVVAGQTQALDVFLEACAAQKIRAQRLPVSGAFHCETMSKAAQNIAKYIENIEFNAPGAVLYSNATGLPYGADIKQTLPKQTVSPVYFKQTIAHMMENGIDTFVEVGPGKTLSGFVKRTSKQVKIYNVDSIESLEILGEI